MTSVYFDRTDDAMNCVDCVRHLNGVIRCYKNLSYCELSQYQYFFVFNVELYVYCL